ncbi:hypothetical protein ILUMI_18182 [Ignelater luminosus]|uniref:Uncharacterized protein n=1 Tax=Ignelater luminosus TaxID=2038154 RepID=A0A8K0CLU3_IGNLU|nr:hypothetical protein ILUMI_18182 [Ignelater luminosus]
MKFSDEAEFSSGLTRDDLGLKCNGSNEDGCKLPPRNPTLLSFKTLLLPATRFPEVFLGILNVFDALNYPICLETTASTALKYIFTELYSGYGLALDHDTAQFSDIYSICLVQVAAAYCTAPTDGMLVITGMIPISLVTDERVRIQNKTKLEKRKERRITERRWQEQWDSSEKERKRVAGNNKVLKESSVGFLGGSLPVVQSEIESEMNKHAKTLKARFFGLTPIDLRKLAYQLATKLNLKHRSKWRNEMGLVARLFKKKSINKC